MLIVWVLVQLFDLPIILVSSLVGALLKKSPRWILIAAPTLAVVISIAIEIFVQHSENLLALVIVRTVAAGLWMWIARRIFQRPKNQTHDITKELM